MGLANLVPGISGGTMLLAAGVYPQFVAGVAEVTALRFQLRNLLLLASIGGAAVMAIGLLAGVVKSLVVDHRWIMYSLFIGLTLGGVPVIWKQLRAWSRSSVIGCVAGILVMALMAVVHPGAAGGDGVAYLTLFLAGLAGASAMILPGVSGGYLLLILGQYIVILDAIDMAKTGVQTGDWGTLAASMHVIVPVGIGVVLGIVGVSNLVKLLLERCRRPTLGVLMGLVLGAVIGLWPFQEGVAPAPGDIIRGQIMTSERIVALDPEDYPLARFSPSAAQVAAVVGLIVGGFLVTQAVALVGGSDSGEKG